MIRRVLTVLALLAIMLTSGATASSTVTPVAHRGDLLVAPENSIPAFRAAAATGVAVELDVRFTSDNYPVVIHDATVDRTTNGTGTVASKTFAQIRSLVLNSGSNPTLFDNLRVPTMWEAMNALSVSSAPIMVEIKVAPANNTQRQRFMEAIIHTSTYDRTTIMAFDAYWAVDLRNYAIANYSWAAPTGVYSDSADLWKITTATRIIAIRHTALVDDTYCDAVQATGRLCYAWTVDEPADWSNLLSYGVDGILTDKVHDLKAWLWFVP